MVVTALFNLQCHCEQLTACSLHCQLFNYLYCNKINCNFKLECGPMPNVMAALPNIGGALCSTPQSLADAHYYSAMLDTLQRRETRWNLQGCPTLPNRPQPLVGYEFTILWGHVKEELLFNKLFFRLLIHALVAKTQPNKVVRWCQDGDFLAIFCVLYFQFIHSFIHNRLLK